MTTDQRMRYQQNMPRFMIGVVVIEARDTRLLHLRPLVPQLREAIDKVARGEVIVVKAT